MVKCADRVVSLIPFTIKSIEKAKFEKKKFALQCDYILPLKHVVYAVLICKYQTLPLGTCPLNVTYQIRAMSPYVENEKQQKSCLLADLVRNKKIFVCPGAFFNTRKTTCE